MTVSNEMLAQAAEEIAKAHLNFAGVLRALHGAPANENGLEPNKAKRNGTDGYRFDVVPNGEDKGKPFGALSTDALEFWESRIQGNLLDPARAKWKKNNQRQLDCIRSILKERRRAEAQAELDAEAAQEADD